MTNFVRDRNALSWKSIRAIPTILRQFTAYTVLGRRPTPMFSKMRVLPVVLLMALLASGQSPEQQDEPKLPIALKILEGERPINELKTLVTHEPSVEIQESPQLQMVPAVLLPGQILKTQLEFEGRAFIVTQEMSPVELEQRICKLPAYSTTHQKEIAVSICRPIAQLPASVVAKDQAPSSATIGHTSQGFAETLDINLPSLATEFERDQGPPEPEAESPIEDPLPPSLLLRRDEQGICPSDPPVTSAARRIGNGFARVSGTRKRLLQPGRIGNFVIAPSHFVEFSSRHGKTERLALKYTHCSDWGCVLGRLGRHSVELVLERRTLCFWSAADSGSPLMQSAGGGSQ